MDSDATRIFRRGSTTFFLSSLFFPAEVRRDVFALYAFVRRADDFVDAVPPRPAEYRAFEAAYLAAAGGRPSGNGVVDDFVRLQQRRGFERAWVDAFFGAMEADLTVTRYATLADVERYMYGSAEVVGLMMARIFGLPDESHPYARLLGKAFQYVNMIRDVEEDVGLGRTYLPLERLEHFGLSSLDTAYARRRPEQFAAFVREQIGHYRAWQAGAELGFRFIPPRYRVAVAAASDMYRHTADRIEADPLLVLRRKVKPSRARVLWRVACNWARGRALPAAAAACGGRLSGGAR
jgi:phytoene synthase